MMRAETNKDLTFNDKKWQTSDTQQLSVSLEKNAETAVLENTISVVKEKVWSFRDAWKGFSEVLCGWGVTPSIAGYSTVPLHEEGYVKEQEEAGSVLHPLSKKEMISRRSRSQILKEYADNSSGSEAATLLNRNEEEVDVHHAFVESSQMELDERKSLTRMLNWKGNDDTLQEHQKEK